MIEPFIQNKRFLQINTPLGQDILILTNLEGEEAISSNFQYKLNLFSQQLDLSASDFLGKPVTITINQNPQSPRYVHGIINHLQAGNINSLSLRQYQITIVPKLWFLTQTTDCKIFQNLTAIEIITNLLKQYNIFDFEINLTNRKLNKREFCVQYSETTYNFFSRLLEEEGIFFYFQHQKDKHILKLANHSNTGNSCHNPINYNINNSQSEQLSDWQHIYNCYPGKISTTDYNYLNPNSNLYIEKIASQNVANNHNYSIYIYPGNYSDISQGNEIATVKLSQQQICSNLVIGAGNYADFTVGYNFTLNEHEIASETGDYLLTDLKIWAHDYSCYCPDPAQTVSQYYLNHFTCIPLKIPYVPPLKSSKPSITGCQTATVTGIPSNEIYTDRYGRIKVKFHWDRWSNTDESSSCWIRVNQNWAGTNYGTLFIQRIGQEVIVSFQEGNPDRPIIIGSLYNATHLPAYDLPNCQTQAGIKTRSSKMGGLQDGNQLRFEDKKGSEEIYIFAQNNFNCETKNNYLVKIGNEQQLISNGNCSFESNQGILLKVGSNSIKIDSSQITLSGKVVNT